MGFAGARRRPLCDGRTESGSSRARMRWQGGDTAWEGIRDQPWDAPPPRRERRPLGSGTLSEAVSGLGLCC